MCLKSRRQSTRPANTRGCERRRSATECAADRS
ncbi:hypothetical protein ebA108 [Aromatoleum aromaticum EbN1]|uniref:Uncharacterized protein n=1 Tax=Aromatoleum aromaticum (strain DSM 19018 / LMG 30748 / EbN1) TaxID=76114 RepID=Q5P926_AROAE|nr:hypothetical protein ebA108 [Aromatoleum aromaticum EbN1]